MSNELFRPEGLEFQDYILRYNPRTLGNPIDGEKGLPRVVILTRKRSKELLVDKDYFWAGNLNNADLTDEWDRTDIAEFLALIKRNTAFELFIGSAIAFIHDRNGQVPRIQERGIGLYPEFSIGTSNLSNIHLNTRHWYGIDFSMDPDVLKVGHLRFLVTQLDYRLGFRKVKHFRREIEEIKAQLPHSNPKV